MLARAKSVYNSKGFGSLVKGAVTHFLKKCRTLPLVRNAVARHRFRMLKMKKPLRLHLGCGSNLLDGYVNIDRYNPKADMMMDACELDYPDDSVDEIFTSHMVEHLTCPEFMKALKEWKRVLKGEGKLVIRCPNFEKHLRDWLNADYRKRWGERNEGVNVILGFQDRGPGHLNRNIFTSDRLSDLVNRAGFEIMECHPVMNRYGDIPDGDILLRARKQKE